MIFHRKYQMKDAVKNFTHLKVTSTPSFKVFAFLPFFWDKNLIMATAFLKIFCSNSILLDHHTRKYVKIWFYLLKMDSSAILKAPIPRRSLGNTAYLCCHLISTISGSIGYNYKIFKK